MSMNTGLLSELIIFTAGAAVGSLITLAIVKRKYSQDEYEYIEETNTESESTVEKEKEKTTTAEPDLVRYNKIAKQYKGTEEQKEEKKEKEVDDVEKPYVISVDEYAEMEDYETNTLYYYADGILTDEQDNVIDDVDDIVGEEALKIFKENPNCDSVYVRNDVHKTDYEILRDFNNYSDKYTMEV